MKLTSLTSPISDIETVFLIGCYGKFLGRSKRKLLRTRRISTVNLFGKLNTFLLLCLVTSLLPSMLSEPNSVIPGIEILLTEQLHLIRGKRIGLITNHTGVDRKLRHDIDLLAGVPGVYLVALFSPEHGIRGTVQAGQKVESTKDEATGITVHSLYGQLRRPTAEMLKNVDVLLYDIQDVGVRFYTYISTLGQCMEAAAENNVPFVVLDRPNPLGGETIEGPMLDLSFQSFVGAYRVPIRYGMTPGELASLIKSTKNLTLDLTVTKMEHWSRRQWYDGTGLIWVPPSPNIPSLNTSLVYAGMCLVEGTNVSEGRGTTQPFEMIGAPWLEGLRISKKLNTLGLPGVLFRPATFIPTFGKFSGESCHGVQLHIVDRGAFRPVMTAISVIHEIRRSYPAQFQFRADHFDHLAGSDKLRNALEQDLSVEAIISSWERELKNFEATRKQFLLYP
jgi:uncharacterized protein YbbC (DUF1343 family)